MLMESREGWVASAEAWVDQVDRGDSSRIAILDSPMLRICGDVQGLRVLDVGCGEGRFCRMLSGRGACTIGIDPTPPLVSIARARDLSGLYLLASGERLPVQVGSFDLVVSYLTLLDIPDYRAAIREMARVLKPGGRLVVANMNGFASTSATGWHKDAQGEKDYYAVDHYMRERAEWVAWGGIRIVNWHRPLSAYMAAFLSEGLKLEEYLEPVPSEAQVAADPALQEDVRVPLFNIMVWRKEA